MAWEPPNRSFLALLATVALFAAGVPLGPGPGAAADAGPAAETVADVSWQPAPNSLAAVMGTGVGVSETTAILTTDASGTFVREAGAERWQAAPNVSAEAGPVAFDPSDPDVAYVGGFGGLARTTDGGGSFESVLTTHRVPVVAVGPGGDVVVGAGNADFELDLLLSEDRGETWTKLDWPSDQYTVKGLAFGEDGDNIVLTTQGKTWVTHDRGQHWSLDEEKGAWSLVSEDDGTLWRANSQYLEKSTDGGDTWQEVEPPKDPWGNPMLFRVLGDRPAGGIFATNSYGVFFTEDGSSWTNMGFPEVAQVATALAVDPEDPQAVYVSDEQAGVGWVGEDTGGSFVYEARTAGLPAPSVDSLALAPDNSKVVAGSHDSGVFVGEPGNGSMTRSTSSLGWILGTAAAPGGEVLYAVGENMIIPPEGYVKVSRDGGQTWDTVWPVDTYSSAAEVVAHPSNPERAWVGMWVAGQPDRLFTTVDAGQTWVTAALLPSGAVYDIAYDASEDRVLVATTAGVYEHDTRTLLTTPVWETPSQAVAAGEDHGYAGGVDGTVASDAAAPTPLGHGFAPWASTDEEIWEMASLSAEHDHAFARTAQGNLFHCVPTADGQGACQAANPATGSPTSLAPSPGGELWVGTDADGLRIATIG